MSDQIIQNQVDLILFEEGKFSVVNWLIKEGYVDYKDYQNWRKGDSPYLEDHFKVTIQAIIADLEVVRSYARKLKLDSIHRAYTSGSDQILHFCRSPANEIIFTTDYEPARNRVQMDLFFDSAPACTSHSPDKGNY